MGGLYAQYGAADEYDPYYGMREAWAGTDYADDRYYNVKDGGRIGLQGGGNPHLDVARPIRSSGLNNLMRRYADLLARRENEKRARIRERARRTSFTDDKVYESDVRNRIFGDPITKREPTRIGLALGGNDEVGGLSGLSSRIPKNVPGVPNGMQVDGRMPGGTYIDAGTRPKADDVAAMLSEGEFVITKDGMEGFDIKTGGPGDSRSGAKKMYAQMNEWEAIAEQAGV